MGHDFHFLERLGRAALPSAELAMTLYNDSALVRELLGGASIPEGVPEVAVSLAEGDQGPFCIVTRGGRFVTCLAEGMKVRPDTPVLPRTEVDRASRRIQVLQEITELKNTLDEQGPQVRKRMSRILRALHEFSREEFVELARFQPLLATFFFSELSAFSTRSNELRHEMFARPVPTRLRSRDEERLRLLEGLEWGAAHLSVLAFAGDTEPIERKVALLDQRSEDGQLFSQNFHIGWGTFQTMYLPMMLRGAWAVGKAGRLFLSAYKQAWRESNSETQVLHGAMGLAAIGLRHSKLQAEVRKCFPRPQLPDDEVSYPLVNALIDLMNIVIDATFEAGAQLVEYPRMLGASMLTRMCKLVPTRDGLNHYEKPEEVPEDLARSFLVNVPIIVNEEFTPLQHLFQYLGWVARCNPEELYLPAAFWDSYHTPYDPHRILERLAAFKKRHGPKVPVKVEQKPGRNDPCPCGSQKKFKKCCGD